MTFSPDLCSQDPILSGSIEKRLFRGGLTAVDSHRLRRYRLSMIRASGLALLLLVATAPTAAAAPEAPTAAAITERGQTLDHILDQILQGGTDSGPRTVILLVDPTPSLVRSRFARAVEEALARQGEAKFALGLAVVGDRRHPRVAPTDDRAAVIGALREVLVLRETEDGIRNVYAPLRALAPALAKRKGRRDIVLVTLENGDGEDDLEKTGDRLEKADAVLHVIGRPALVADSYWPRVLAAARRTGAAREKADLRGQEAAYDDLPWGWQFQRPSTINEYVSSGFGMFGLSRLVARTGGRYFLYYPVGAKAYQQCQIGACPICRDDHADCGQRYQDHRIRALAPGLASRAQQRKTLARDPLFMAILDAWNRASTAHIVYSRPPLRRGPGLLREEERRVESWGGLLQRPDFPDVSRRAKKLEALCAEIALDLGRALKATPPEKTTPRHVALAETVRCQALVTRLNCHLLRAFCDRAPAWRDRPREGLVPPEIPTFDPDPATRRDIIYTIVGFCHGTKAVTEFALPGLADAGKVRDEAFAAVEALRTRYDGTPFGRVARLSGVAVFRYGVTPHAAGASAGRAARGAAGGRTGQGTTTGGR
jgi:hypothetical protein